MGLFVYDDEFIKKAEAIIEDHIHDDERLVLNIVASAKMNYRLGVTIMVLPLIEKIVKNKNTNLVSINERMRLPKFEEFYNFLNVENSPTVCFYHDNIRNFKPIKVSGIMMSMFNSEAIEFICENKDIIMAFNNIVFDPNKPDRFMSYGEDFNTYQMKDPTSHSR